MNLVTVTVDLDTHAIVPREATGEMKLSCVYMQVHSAIEEEWANMLAAAPPYQSEQVNSQGLFDSWMTIDTAPKDGTWVLAINAKTNATRQHIVSFYKEENTKFQWKTGSGNMYWVAGLTHWMKLPSAPKGEELPSFLKNQVDIFGDKKD